MPEMIQDTAETYLLTVITIECEYGTY